MFGNVTALEGWKEADLVEAARLFAGLGAE